MIERKCLACKTWNHDEAFCKSCGAALSPEEIRRQEDANWEEQQSKKPRPKLDILYDRAKNSKYLVVRILFYAVYSVAVVVFAIASFAAYLVAWSPA